MSSGLGIPLLPGCAYDFLAREYKGFSPRICRQSGYIMWCSQLAMCLGLPLIPYF